MRCPGVRVLVLRSGPSTTWMKLVLIQWRHDLSVTRLERWYCGYKASGSGCGKIVGHEWNGPLEPGAALTTHDGGEAGSSLWRLLWLWSRALPALSILVVVNASRTTRASSCTVCSLVQEVHGVRSFIRTHTMHHRAVTKQGKKETSWLHRRSTCSSGRQIHASKQSKHVGQGEVGERAKKKRRLQQNRQKTAPAGDRTQDLCVISTTLYQLSSGSCGDGGVCRDYMYAFFSAWGWSCQGLCGSVCDNWWVLLR